MGPAFASGGMGGGSPFGGMPFDFADLNMDGIFGDLLSALGVKVGDRGTLDQDLRISFEEAAFGCTKEVTYTRMDVCEPCAGSGATPGTRVDSCPECGGRGRLRFQQGVFPIAVEKSCPRCHGAGRIVQSPCAACRGGGLAPIKRTVEVTVPAGIDDGAVHSVQRGGSKVRADRPPGDLEITVRIDRHPVFRRAGDDVVCSLDIPFAQAALGGDVQVTTLDGPGKLRIPAGTQPGQVLRVKGKGMGRKVMGGRGDQLVEIQVVVPTKLTEDQRELLLRFSDAMGETIAPPEEGFIRKLKTLFG